MTFAEEVGGLGGGGGRREIQHRVRVFVCVCVLTHAHVVSLKWNRRQKGGLPLKTKQEPGPQDSWIANNSNK